MHPNPAFRQTSDAENLAFARKRGFGTLSINAEPAPLVAHIPFVVRKSDNLVDLHLLRSNPIVRMLKEPQAAVISVLGPDSYISPDWYGVADQVPTWNYVAVHLRGTLCVLPQAELAEILDDLSAQFETRLAPKPVWSSDKMDPSALKKMMRMIVPLHLQITEVHGTWKLGQNKPDPVRGLAADNVNASGIGHETQALAVLMRNPPTP